ncbi:HNH endonuclease [Rahnella sp. GSA61A]|uniref:HNH endonuclease n=1 Tax=Rahnella sp. GSA61A TaxID=2862678 RepID=UPI001CBF6D1C|nr:HNH endonuclease [Rahnella sp. GSA61A]
MSETRDKIDTPVVYHDHLQDYYISYCNDPSKHDGKKWEDKDDEILVEIKEHIKKFYYTAQFHTCVYCKQEIVVKNLSTWDAEHIFPKDKYPQFLLEPKNLCLACKDCNRAKWNQEILLEDCGSTYPNNGNSTKIIHPHFDDYKLHINILKAGSLYHAKTKKGADTISTCGLFRFLGDTSYSDVSTDLIEKVIETSEAVLESNDSSLQLALIETAIKDLETVKDHVVKKIIAANPGLNKNLSKPRKKTKPKLIEGN